MNLRDFVMKLAILRLINGCKYGIHSQPYLVPLPPRNLDLLKFDKYGQQSVHVELLCVLCCAVQSYAGSRCDAGWLEPFLLQREVAVSLHGLQHIHRVHRGGRDLRLQGLSFFFSCTSFCTGLHCVGAMAQWLGKR